jgi:uncharacterized protein (UPF0335 family)
MNVVTAEQVGAIRDAVRGRARPASSDAVAADVLRNIVERIERLEVERKERSDDIKDIYTEAKSAGFDVAVLRDLIRTRKKEADAVEEHESLLDVYRHALGM